MKRIWGAVKAVKKENPKIPFILILMRTAASDGAFLRSFFSIIYLCMIPLVIIGEVYSIVALVNSVTVINILLTGILSVMLCVLLVDFIRFLLFGN